MTYILRRSCLTYVYDSNVCSWQLCSLYHKREQGAGEYEGAEVTATWINSFAGYMTKIQYALNNNAGGDT